MNFGFRNGDCGLPDRIGTLFTFHPFLVRPPQPPEGETDLSNQMNFRFRISEWGLRIAGSGISG